MCYYTMLTEAAEQNKGSVASCSGKRLDFIKLKWIFFLEYKKTVTTPYKYMKGNKIWENMQYKI